MTTSPPWMRALAEAVRRGLNALYKEPPLTAVEWADTHFYLSSESSYQQGRWVAVVVVAVDRGAEGRHARRHRHPYRSAYPPEQDRRRAGRQGAFGRVQPLHGRCTAGNARAL